MRHGKKFNHLGRTAPHRKAMLSNMATSLIMNKRITTTVAKAKALRKYVEPILTKAKDDTTHSRRVVFSYLNNKDSVKTLFDEVAGKIAERPGGYTRILKTGNRLGDNADMCIIELVDYNELLLGDAPKKSKTRRSRRGKGGSTKDAEAKATSVAEEEVEVSEEAAVDEVEEAVEAEIVEEPVVEDTKEEVVSDDVVVEEETTKDNSVEDVEASSEEATDETEEDNKDKDADK
ncbi:MAG: 50S ribosomal protein L17 [Bacteroidota bacterium]